MLAFLSRQTRIAALRVIALLVTTAIFIRTAWVSDDAFITLRTIDNLVHGYGLRWNVVERVQTFTHPLWLFLVAIPYYVTREAFYTCAILSIAVSIIVVGLFIFRARAGGAAALALGTAMLVSSRAFVDYSTSGLENPLTHLLVALFLIAFLKDAPASLGRVFLLSGITGLATLNRMDSILLFAPALLYATFGCGGVRALGALVGGFIPFLLWEGFAVFYYGSLVPNSAFAKLNTGIDAITYSRHGLYYILNSLRNDPVTMVVILVAMASVVASRGTRRQRLIAIASGILLYLLYVVRIGGDFMSGRFLSAPFLAAVILLAEVDPFPLRKLGRGILAAGVLISGLGLTPHPPIRSGRDFGGRMEGLVDRHGICDERRYYFAGSGMLNEAPAGEKPSGWGPSVVGGDARRNGTPLVVEEAVGAAGYLAGPRTHMLDYYALCDPLLSRIPSVLNDTRYEKWMLQMFGDRDPQGWRIGHHKRNVPSGYLATIMTGENRIQDRQLAAFYDRLRPVTQGPLWSIHRFAAAIQLSFGRWNGLLPRGRPEQDEPIDWMEVLAVDPNLPEALFRIGEELAEAGDLDEAGRRLEEAIRLDPRHARALLLMGRICQQTGDAQRANAYFDRVRATVPGLGGGSD